MWWWTCWPCYKKHRTVTTISGEEKDIWDIHAEAVDMRKIIRSSPEMFPILAHALTTYRFGEVEYAHTKYNTYFVDCIRASVACPRDTRVAIAPDPEAYKIFRVFFDYLFLHLHDFKQGMRHKPTFYGNSPLIKDLDPRNEFIVSLRIECSRNLKDYPFVPHMTKEQLLEVQDIIKEAYETLQGRLHGKYAELITLSADNDPEFDQWNVVPTPNVYDATAYLCKYWPIGRGIGYNEFKSFIIWVNQEDHLKVIVHHPYGNLNGAYVKLEEGMTHLDKILDFIRDERIGYYTVDPGRVGNGLRISARIRLPELNRHQHERERIAEDFRLLINRAPSSTGDVFEITHTVSLGVCELESITAFQTAIEGIMNEERKAARERFDEDKLSTQTALKLTEYITGEIKSLEGVIEIPEVETDPAALRRKLYYRKNRN